MGDVFPTALQRTSDERWVTLDVVVREDDRTVARIPESPGMAAAIRLDGGEAHDLRLRALLASPPPDAGRGVHISWPVDLLHDLDGRVVGYTSRRHTSGRTFPLAEFVDPARRAEIAPLATRRHLLRVARNVATAVAALHHAGHARIDRSQFRVDDRGRVVVVRVDELVPDAAAGQRTDDERRLANLMVRLLDGQPWPTGEVTALLATASSPGAPAPPATAWFHALRQAERELPPAPQVARPSPQAPETTAVASRDLASALREARTPRTEPAHPGPRDTGSAAPEVGPAPTVPSPPAAAEEGDDPETPPRPPEGPPPRPALRHTDLGAGRPTFALAVGLFTGVVASVAPFLVFLAVLASMVLARAVQVALRRSSHGPHQTVAIALSRLVPFATGGIAFGAFILLDLLLVLGLCMALAELLFDYGPGFTLTWIQQLPEVPGLVRAFAFAVAALGGTAVGGPVYDRVRETGRRRAIALPAVALAVAAGALAFAATVVWWPLPIVA